MIKAIYPSVFCIKKHYQELENTNIYLFMLLCYANAIELNDKILK